MDLTEATLKNLMEERADLFDEIVENAVGAKNEQITELEKKVGELDAQLKALKEEDGKGDEEKKTLEDRLAALQEQVDAAQKGTAADELLRTAGVTEYEDWERDAVMAKLDKPEEAAAVVERLVSRAPAKPTSTLKNDAEGAATHKELVERTKRHLKGRARARLAG